MPACQSSVTPTANARPAALAAPPSFADGVPPLHLSDAVVARVGAMLADEGDEALQLRIFVSGGGCAGFQYGFAFDDETHDDDVRVTRGSVAVVVDAVSLQYLAGAEIDYEDRLEGARFVIRNPNATSTCGCGSSFGMAGAA